MLKTKEEVEEWLKKYAHPEIYVFNEDYEVKIDLGKWTVNEDLTVDVDGDVKIIEPPTDGRLPFRFGRVSGDFDCSNMQLTSLKGSPKAVDGYFDCENNQLSTLEASPIEVGGNFNCRRNQLTSLKDSPKEVGGNFYCDLNQLISLKGSPKKIGGGFSCSDNQLSTLDGAPEIIERDFVCMKNPLEKLGDISTQVGGRFNFYGPPIPEFASYFETNIYGHEIVSAKNFNTKVSELKAIRDEKALLESSVAKLCGSTPIGSLPKPVVSQTAPEQTVAPKRKFKI